MKPFRMLTLVISCCGMALCSCENESLVEDFHDFLLSNAQETYSCRWNIDSLATIYTIDRSNEIYPLAFVKVINSREEFFSMLIEDSVELSERQKEHIKRLPQHIDVDFSRQSVVYFGLSGEVCNRVVANVHQDGHTYLVRVLSYLPDDWATNWTIGTMACSAVFPKVSTEATFSIETVEIEGGTQEAQKVMANEKWFDVRN